MEILHLNHIKKEMSGSLLFTIDQARIQSGSRLVLLGQNGAGKSTLLRMLVGEDGDYQGDIRITPNIAYVPQLKPSSPQSGGEQVLQALKQAFGQFSELLILDEPTSHLDMENVEWLIHQLKRYRGTLLMVSHDRYFIDQLANQIWVLEDQTLTSYSCDFATFKEQCKSEQIAHWKAYEQYQKKVHRLQETMRFKKDRAQKITKKKKNVSLSDWKVNSRLGSYDGKAKSMAKVAKAIEKQINRLDKVEKPKKALWAKLKPATTLPSRGALLHLKSGRIMRENKALFSYEAFRIVVGDKIALKGRNKSGKTSFAKDIVQRQLDGSYSQHLRLAYFEQNQGQLDTQQSSFDNVAITSQQDRITILNALAMMGLPYQKALQKVDSLSGGERSRVALVKVLLSDSNLLILDEPTNFLDLVAIEALERFLQDYSGAVLLISHDCTFLDKVTDKTYQIEDGRLKKQ